MKFDFDIRWLGRGATGEALDPRLFILLRAIRDRGSLKHAARACGISYRLAWDLFRKWQQQFGEALAVFEQGRGASLSELGEKLLWAEQVIAARLEPQLGSLAEEINRELDRIVEAGRSTKKLHMHASHDLALAYLEELCAKSPVLTIDFQFRGSLECLRELAGGHCDVAGFHFPRGELSTSLARQYRYWLDEDRVQLLQLGVRQQGLMTAAGNPRRVKGLKDLTRRSLRFINRQKESGTRIIFDELLRHAEVDRDRIKGYHDEEFTHLAVAAMLGSGAADVGFGIKAAATKFGLHFIPLVEENYALAINRSVDDAVLKALQGLLRSAAFEKKINSLPGYSLTNTGKLISIEKLLAGK